MTDCEMCGYEDFAKIDDILFVYLCPDCTAKVEEHHKVDGKFVVVKCPTCHKIERIEFHAYKKRGTKPGTKLPPRKIKNCANLDEFGVKA